MTYLKKKNISILTIMNKNENYEKNRQNSTNNTTTDDEKKMKKHSSE